MDGTEEGCTSNSCSAKIRGKLDTKGEDSTEIDTTADNPESDIKNDEPNPQSTFVPCGSLGVTPPCLMGPTSDPGRQTKITCGSQSSRNMQSGQMRSSLRSSILEKTGPSQLQSCCTCGKPPEKKSIVIKCSNLGTSNQIEAPCGSGNQNNRCPCSGGLDPCQPQPTKIEVPCGFGSQMKITCVSDKLETKPKRSSLSPGNQTKCRCSGGLEEMDPCQTEPIQIEAPCGLESHKNMCPCSGGLDPCQPQPIPIKAPKNNCPCSGGLDPCQPQPIPIKAPKNNCPCSGGLDPCQPQPIPIKAPKNNCPCSGGLDPCQPQPIPIKAPKNNCPCSGGLDPCQTQPTKIEIPCGLGSQMKITCVSEQLPTKPKRSSLGPGKQTKPTCCCSGGIEDLDPCPAEETDPKEEPLLCSRCGNPIEDKETLESSALDSNLENE